MSTHHKVAELKTILLLKLKDFSLVYRNIIMFHSKISYIIFSKEEKSLQSIKFGTMDSGTQPANTQAKQSLT